MALAAARADGVEVGGIGGCRHDGRVAGAHQGQAEVAEAFLRPQADDHFPLRVQADAVGLEILGGHFPPQAEDAHGLAVAVIFGVAGGLGQLFDDQVLGRIGGVAHAQVDHVVAGAAFFVHQAIDLGEQIGGQPPDAFRHLDRERPILRDRLARRGYIAHPWGPPNMDRSRARVQDDRDLAVLGEALGVGAESLIE